MNPADKLVALIKKLEAEYKDERLRENALYSGLFDRHVGIYSDSPGPGRLRRRAWIESFFPIRNKEGAIQLLKLNPAQRRLEALVLRMERAGLPVRVIICKARQQGFSTYVQALAFERVLRGRHMRALIIADTRDKSEILLNIAHVGRTSMVKRETGVEPVLWNFRMTSRARDSHIFAPPINGEILITSAEEDAPGRGGTRNVLHMSETAHWARDADYAGVGGSLPSIPRTYGFDESTANGSGNRFAKDFWRSWHERGLKLRERVNPWSATFFGWWEHPDYRWTRTYGAMREIPPEMLKKIREGTTTEESWLLKQRYFRRWEPTDEWDQVATSEGLSLVIEGRGEKARVIGQKRNYPTKPTKWRRRNVGWRTVDIDQLCWRRMKMQDKDIGGDEDIFNQEYPSRPEVAFLATGRPVFNQAAIDAALVRAKDCTLVFQGALRRASIDTVP